MTQEVLKLALEALKRATNYDPVIARAITAIKEALAQPEQEPVAWRWIPSDVWGSYVLSDSSERAKLADEHGLNPQPLYTTPPQRTWVGLTDEEYKELHLQMGPVYYYQEYGQAIEAKLKEKNT